MPSQEDTSQEGDQSAIPTRVQTAAETTTSIAVPGRENSPDSRVTGGAPVSSAGPDGDLGSAHSTGTAAHGSSEPPGAPLASPPTAASETQAGSVRVTSESHRTRWTEPDPGGASSLVTSVSPSPSLGATAKISPSKGASPPETSTDTLSAEATRGPATDPLTIPTGVPVPGSSSPGRSTAVTQTTRSAPVTRPAEVGTAGHSSALGTTRLPSEMVSSALPELSSRETPDSRERRSPGLTPSNTGHPSAPREPGSEEDTTLTASVSLPSPASDLGDEASGSSTSPVQRVTCSVTMGIPGSAARTEPNSAVTFLLIRSNPAASSGSVSRAASPLAGPSPSGEETAGSELPVSTSPETSGSPSLPTARTLASEPWGGPGTLSITPAFPSAATTSQTHTALRDDTWPETSPEFETRSPLARGAASETASLLSATGVAPRSSPTSGSSTLDLTSGASDESLTLTASNENTVTSWLHLIRRYHSPGGDRQHQCVRIRISRPPQHRSWVELIPAPPCYLSIDRAHTPSGPDHCGTQEKTHVRGNKTCQLRVPSRGATSSMGTGEDAGTSLPASGANSSPGGEVSSSPDASTSLSLSADSADLPSSRATRAPPLDPTASAWVSSSAFPDFLAQTSHPSPKTISSSGLEHSSLGVETGLASSSSGPFTSSEAKRVPSWTSGSTLPEVPPNRGTDGTVVSVTHFPAYEGSSWLNSDPSAPVSVVDSAGPQESVMTSTGELSEGTYGGTTWPTGDPTPLRTVISPVTGLPTRRPGTSEDTINPSSREPSGSHETRITLRETPKETAPVDTTETR
ncbi:mucin-16-like [Suricata suricatta]|uniref:mucin-16-like n=1 Tax=Suricata suricatta TaxID=37032 RepID=UPI00115572E0|nr:mucin-16-like [Suricata suricatta]